MKFYLVLSFFCFFLLKAESYPLIEVQSVYIDDELEALWSSMNDINKPSLEDYLLVENYLKYGKRPYLDEFLNMPLILKFCKENNITKVDRSYDFSSRILQRMMLVGPNKAMPIFKRLYLGGASPDDLSRCIVFYVSYNVSPHPFEVAPLYTEKMYDVIRELQAEGYKGHVLFRIGGYPLIDRGGLRLAHVPYSFKVLSLIEASILGYDDVLWLDISIHPTNDLEDVFSKISKNGFFLLGNAVKMNWEYEHGLLSDAALSYSSLHPEALANIEQIWAAIIGISFKNSKAHDLVREWYRLTTEVYPAMTLYPEQFLLSVAAWRAKLQSTGNYGSYTYFRTCVPQRPSHEQTKPFWFDKS